VKTWIRAGVGQVCGRCGTPVPLGAALLVITLPTTRLTRCAACDGPAPPDLPERVEVSPLGPPMRPLSGILPFGFDRVREPGEDG
jgi:hypothetical protein